MARKMYTFLLSLSLCLSGSVAAVAASGDKWQPYVEFEFKPGNERTIGQTDFVMPLKQDANSLLTANVRFMTANDVHGEHSLGLGYRKIIDDKYIVGGYGFWDRRYTENENIFDQATVGVEVLAENWGIRVNGYLPLGEDEQSLGAAGTTVNIVGTTLAVVNGGGSEKTLGGMDFELGRKIPLWDDTWVYAGAFEFNNSEVNRVAGPRGRFETRIHDLPALGEGARLTLGVEIQRDSIRDNQGFALARLRIPFGSKTTSTLSGLDRRMMDPIVRDVDIVSASRSVSAAPITPTVSINGTDVSASNIVFVSAAGGIGATGTQADPTTLANAITQVANTVVVVDGAGGVIANEDFTMGVDTMLIGAATDLTLTGGNASVVLNFGGTRPSLVDPNLGGSGIITSNSTFVKGIDLIGSNQPVTAIGVAGVHIEDVTTNTSNLGMFIGGGTSNLQIVDSTIQNTVNSGLAMQSGTNVVVTNLAVNTVGTGGGGGTAIQMIGASGAVFNTVSITGAGGTNQTGVSLSANSDNVTMNDVTINYPTILIALNLVNSDNFTMSDFVATNMTDGIIFGGTVNNPSGNMTATVSGGVACGLGNTVNGSTVTMDTGGGPVACR